ncbi:HAD-IIIC family phosphatase [Massilia pseudoviolaceinigra]|uniref:HAD-IIIC family phosphatase n=1 Tax=Massilia pseudoviolaceinigra TaxID=3057165 RepID=UPI0027967006|nr:HAD-IIIC family phosphatase [Massilia sp. CCM 9206]MDQ1920916.1 HAD-IIIC family phosphatase [Massilia sp. CCM 9206]
MKNTPRIKCVIWDLDGTIWNGTLLEDSAVELKSGIADLIRTLDSYGILQSVASKNDHDVAWPVLESMQLAQYFLHPQINWAGKADSVRAIGERLGIGLDTLALIDDRIEERDEVQYFLPQVTAIDGADSGDLLNLLCLQPGVVTDDGRERRKMYQADIARTDAEEKFEGKRDAFLQTLGMRMTISRAGRDDLRRAEELTLRTNQLNTTGRTYSFDELEALANSPDHLLLVAKLEDCYGSYGTIGLTLVEKNATAWTIQLLIMSCRVITRGVGSVLIGYLLRLATDAGVHLRADFCHTGRNRQMYMTYKFSGFRELATTADSVVLEHDLRRINPYPGYISVTSEQ